MLNITDRLRDILTRLGWEIHDTSIVNTHWYFRSKTETSMYLRGVRVTGGHRTSVSASKFVLGCDDKDAIYQDVIKSATINLDNPHWENRLFRWHASATFRLAELRAKHAERDHTKKKKAARLEEHRAQLDAITSNSQHLHGSGRMDDGAFESMRFDTETIHVINMALSRQPSAEAAARLGVKLIDYLRTEGFLQ